MTGTKKGSGNGVDIGPGKSAHTDKSVPKHGKIGGAGPKFAAGSLGSKKSK